MKKLLAWKYHSCIALPLRFFVGGVFLFACYHKILDPAAFALDIASYQILPVYFINPMAIILPYLELITGMMIIVGLRTRPAVLLINGMLFMFFLAVTISLAKGLEMSCGCFASSTLEQDPITLITVFRDFGLWGIALYILIFDPDPIGLDRLLKQWGRKRRTHAD